MATARTWLTPALFAACVSIVGCGGGGGSGGGASNPAPATSSTNTVAAATSNVQMISVDSGLPVANSVNVPFVSVTLCEPGNGNNCQTIDHIVVDNASSGLRIMSSALSPSLSLQQQTDARGNPVAECAHFVDGNTWGSVKLADMQIAGERAGRLPIQVIGDPNFAVVPGACSARAGRLKNTVQALGANGILGVSVFRQDCGSACAQLNNLGIYYTCTVASGCQQTPVSVDLQLQNPVSKFAVNNNGVIIELPALPAAGATGVKGSLVFGIGTQANNGLGAATVISVDPATGNFTTIYNGNTYAGSFVDSGSNGFFFRDSILVCAGTTAAPGFYCPASTINGSATIQGANGAVVPISFSVANAATLLANNPAFAAFSNLAAPQFASTGFDWGLPFFYGRSVYTAIEGAATPGGPTGPYVAF